MGNSIVTQNPAIVGQTKKTLAIGPIQE